MSVNQEPISNGGHLFLNTATIRVQKSCLSVLHSDDENAVGRQSRQATVLANKHKKTRTRA